MTGKFFFGLFFGIILGVIVVFFVSFYASYDVSMEKRESLKVDEAEIPLAALNDLEIELENE